MGKGSKRRPEDREAIRENWDKIFKKEKEVEKEEEQADVELHDQKTGGR